MQINASLYGWGLALALFAAHPALATTTDLSVLLEGKTFTCREFSVKQKFPRERTGRVLSVEVSFPRVTAGIVDVVVDSSAERVWVRSEYHLRRPVIERGRRKIVLVEPESGVAIRTSLTLIVDASATLSEIWVRKGIFSRITPFNGDEVVCRLASAPSARRSLLRDEPEPVNDPPETDDPDGWRGGSGSEYSDDGGSASDDDDYEPRPEEPEDR